MPAQCSVELASGTEVPSTGLYSLSVKVTEEKATHLLRGSVEIEIRTNKGGWTDTNQIQFYQFWEPVLHGYLAPLKFSRQIANNNNKYRCLLNMIQGDCVTSFLNLTDLDANTWAEELNFVAYFTDITETRNTTK